MTKIFDCVFALIDLVRILDKDLQHQTRRGLPLTPMQQVLIALRFYATGTFERVIGDLFGVSVFAACTVIHKVSRAITKRNGHFLSFPENLADTKKQRNAMAFVNRKQFYSINVQAFCESDAFITNILARWPGSTYGLCIFENSKIAEKLREGTIGGILVGDSGYACRAYLMTPILEPKNAGEVRYSTAHRRTRCVIERCFGLLKRRFPCLPFGLHTALANTLVGPRQCCIISPICIESKTLMKTSKMKMFHLTLLLLQTQVGMPNASLLFHDTLLSKNKELIKLPVRFIINRIGNKRQHSPQLVNLYFVSTFISVTYHDMNKFKLQDGVKISSSMSYAGGKPIPMLVDWCINFHSFSIRTFIFNLCSSLAMDKNGSSSGESGLLRLHLSMSCQLTINNCEKCKKLSCNKQFLGLLVENYCTSDYPPFS